MGKRIGQPLGQALVALARNPQAIERKWKSGQHYTDALWHES
jgi:hypothetical protein